MDSDTRRKALAEYLGRARSPVSAAALAGVLSLLTSAAGLPEVDVE